MKLPKNQSLVTSGYHGTDVIMPPYDAKRPSHKKLLWHRSCITESVMYHTVASNQPIHPEKEEKVKIKNKL